MEISAAIKEALHLLFTGDAGLWEIVSVSLGVSLSALAVVFAPALAVAYMLATRDFVGRRALLALLQGALSFPTVAVGLILYMLLSRQGPLGAWNLLFTPEAMAIGQALIAFPVLVIFALTALQKNDARVRETAENFGRRRSAGAGAVRAALTEIYEARFGIVAALLTGFGRVVSEVGCALMVGGNIAHYTRTIPTAIALETGKGMFAEGIALGIVLIFLAVATSAMLSLAQGRGR